MVKLAKILAVLLVLYALASAGVAWYATSTHKPSLPASTASLGFSVEDVQIAAPDGTVLRGWYAPGPGGSPAIALFHGYRETRQQCVPIARALTLSGFDLLLLDSRGCGQSEGSMQTFGAKEAQDISAAIQFLRNAKPHHARRIGALGIGTGASAIALAAESMKDCAGVVLLGPYTTLDSAIDRRMKCKAGIGLTPMGELTAQIVGWRIGASPSRVRPIDMIARLSPCPVLLVGAADDAATPPEDMQALFSAAAEPKELLVVPGISRDRLADLNGSLLKQKLIDFFEAQIR